MVTSLKHFVNFVRSHSASVVLEKLKLNLMQSQSLTMIRLHWLTKVHLLQKMGNPSLVYLQKFCLVLNNKYFVQKFYRHYRLSIAIIHLPVYRQGKTNVRYNIQYGIALHVKQMLIYVKNIPFTFKFDESTTSQVKKQYMMLIYNFGQKHMMK